MLGRANFLQTVNCDRLIAAAITAAAALAIGLSALAPSSAHASGCTDSWTNTEGGSWFTGSNWSKGTPPTSEEEACITAEGTYTVTMTQTSGTVSVSSLTIGGESGTQTLAVGSSCSVNAILTTTAGISNGAHGAITLTNGDGCGDSVTLSGPISSAGTITSEPAHGGSRSLQGSLTNKGTLAIETNTAYNGTSAVLTNEGALNVAEGKQLTVSGKNSLANRTGGSISATGSGSVLMSGTSFTEGAGTTSGTKPVIVDDGALSYTPGKGKSLIALRGTSALSGNLASGQSLSIESTCSENALTTAAASFTNGGTITLTNGDGCGDSATLDISAGTLTNSGKITTEPEHGGTRTLQGSIANTGTLAINVNTAYSGSKGALTNEGAIKLAEATQLTVSNEGSVTDGTGGSIAATGSADVFMDPGTAFSEGAGTTSGTKPVIVDDGALSYTGAGASVIALHGESSTSGNLSAGQSLSIESTCSENAKTTAGASFTNGGTITLTNGDGCGDSATLVISAGTLTNTGRVAVEPEHGGTRTLQGSITNTGTLAIKANTAYNGTSALLSNEGAVNLSEGIQLTVSGGDSFTNGTGGAITAASGSDVLMDPGTAFSEGAGTTSGTKPVIVDDGALSYTGAGASVIALHGESSTSGNLSAGQSLSIESTCSENAKTTAGASFTNGGTITLTNGDGCGNSATLTVSGTLTDTGRIVTEPALGGSRTLQGDLTNASTGTLAIRANTAYNGTGAVMINEGAINVTEGKQLTITGGGSVTNGSGGSIFAPGTAAFFQTGGTFTEGAGTTGGIRPVILDDATLIYGGTSAEHGSGPISLRGTSTVTGPVRFPEGLLIESTCNEHAVVSATASFFVAGRLELTNGDGCGNNATLNMKGGTLTNDGALVVNNPHGGARAIEGNLINNKGITVAAGATLQVSGSYTQSSAGSFKTLIASASSFGSLSVKGSATIAGTLILRQVSFKATLGQKFAILSSAALTGRFATETEDQVGSSGLYYQPTYSATGVTLLVAEATLLLSVTSGLPGSVVTISGSGYLPGDTITPTLTDPKGVTTTYPTVTTNGSGEFSTEITVPVSAAVGSGASIKVKSALTGVKIGHPFKVT